MKPRVVLGIVCSLCEGIVLGLIPNPRHAAINNFLSSLAQSINFTDVPLSNYSNEKHTYLKNGPRKQTSSTQRALHSTEEGTKRVLS